MERKLLLLGLLRWQEMHGYQLNEFIETHLGTSIELKKPTVYKMLGLMVDDGWIDYHEEQQGNYPTRRVYRITAAGEEAFQELLRQNLATYTPISYLGNIGIVYLEALPGKEAAALLREHPDRFPPGHYHVAHGPEQSKIRSGILVIFDFVLGQTIIKQRDPLIAIADINKMLHRQRLHLRPVLTVFVLDWLDGPLVHSKMP